ncbi:MAG TPA: helix-turn-helix domain-containing protein [Pseudonocardiaceae bacterium]|jgi:excisionase family DNA binding protein
MTVAEVASALRVSKMTIYRLIRSGELPAMRIGRSFRVSEAAYHTYLNSLA